MRAFFFPQLFKLIFHQILFFLTFFDFDTIFIHDGLHVLSVSQQLIIFTCCSLCSPPPPPPLPPPCCCHLCKGNLKCHSAALEHRHTTSRPIREQRSKSRLPPTWRLLVIWPLDRRNPPSRSALVLKAKFHVATFQNKRAKQQHSPKNCCRVTLACGPGSEPVSQRASRTL